MRRNWYGLASSLALPRGAGPFLASEGFTIFRTISVEMAVVGCIFTVFSTLLLIAKVYDAGYTDVRRQRSFAQDSSKRVQFLHEHFLEPRKREGIDTSALTETLRKLTVGLQAIERMVKDLN
ncbi:MAG TPA: hypothetical protein VK937_17730 [Candidatus Limnocylindria bacterium]|nr:hypothetical protein [Candidatus Limnocylindria bacterium]